MAKRPLHAVPGAGALALQGGRARPLSPGCRRRFEISQRISTLNLKLDYAHETVEARRMQLQVVSLSQLLSLSPSFYRPCQ